MLHFQMFRAGRHRRATFWLMEVLVFPDNFDCNEIHNSKVVGCRMGLHFLGLCISSVSHPFHFSFVCHEFFRVDNPTLLGGILAPCYGLSPQAMVTWIQDFSSVYRASTGRYASPSFSLSLLLLPLPYYAI
jgi:hypothetical protein